MHIGNQRHNNMAMTTAMTSRGDEIDELFGGDTMGRVTFFNFTYNITYKLETSLLGTYYHIENIHQVTLLIHCTCICTFCPHLNKQTTQESTQFPRYSLFLDTDLVIELCSIKK